MLVQLGKAAQASMVPVVDLSLEQMSPGQKTELCLQKPRAGGWGGWPKAGCSHPGLLLDWMVGKGLPVSQSHSLPLLDVISKLRLGGGGCPHWNCFISGLRCGNLSMEARIAATRTFHPGWARGLRPGAPDGE